MTPSLSRYLPSRSQPGCELSAEIYRRINDYAKTIMRDKACGGLLRLAKGLRNLNFIEMQSRADSALLQIAN